jgi:hypothetical protein
MTMTTRKAMTRLYPKLAIGLTLVGLAAGASGVALAGAQSPSLLISACLRHNSGVFYAADRCHPRDARLAWNMAGPPGPAGVPGAPGPPGPTGAQGEPGVSAGAQSGGNDPPALDGLPNQTQTITDTVLTTRQPGGVFAAGYLDVQAGCGPLICGFTAGLYVDGRPVPGSARHVDLPVFASTPVTLDLFGIAPGVPAGTHHITIGLRAPVNLPSITANGETHSAAIEVGSNTDVALP